MIKTIKQFLPVVFAISIIWLTTAHAQEDLDKQIKSSSKELEKIQQEIKDFEKDLKQAKNRERSALTKLNETEEQISLTRRYLAQLEKEQKQREKNIGIYKQDIVELEANLDKLKKNFARRLVHIYKKGELNDLELLLNSESLNQAVYRYKYLKIISDIDKQTAEEIHINIAKIDEKKTKTSEELRQKKLLIAEQSKYKTKLASQKRQVEKNLNLARNDQKSLAHQKQQKEAAVKKLLAMIEGLEKEKERRQRELARQRAKSGIVDAGHFAKNRGKLIWPVNGKVTARFGRHKHPTLNTITENSGIDIKAGKGVPVSAVLDGVISTITYIRGFGTTIIIDHGGGYYTVYTHVQNIRVFVDDYIEAGVAIAEVGESGSLTGPTLHFEIWNKQEKLNPEDWLVKR